MARNYTLKCLCKNKRELKAIVFKGFFLHKVVKKKKKNKTHRREVFLNYPITIPFRRHSQTAQHLGLFAEQALPIFIKKALKNYLSAHSRDTNIQFGAGCLEETPERLKWITTSTSNASLCIIQPPKLSPSLLFPDSVTRGCFRWPARKFAHSDRKPWGSS